MSGQNANNIIAEQLSAQGFSDCRFLAEGAQGLAFRANLDGTPVAVKVLKKFGAHAGDDSVRTFAKEVASVACINEPRLAQIVHSGIVNGQPYFANEFIEGQTLEKILAMGALEVPIAVGIIQEICHALISIHEAGFVHRDIKPGNVMVTSDHRAKLIDFGLVTRSDEGHDNRIAGTLRYASPEQLRVLKRGVDDRSDIYSLGITLYECLTGAPPFVDEDINALLNSHLRTIPPLASRLNSKVPEALAAVVAKAVSKDPEDRYQSAEQFLFDLSQIEQIEADVPDSGQFRLGRLVESKRQKEMVGRDREMSELVRQWSGARAGEGKAVMVTGLSGFGKTFLVESFLRTNIDRASCFFFKGKNEEKGAHPMGAFHEAIDEALKTIAVLEPSQAAVWKNALLNVSSNFDSTLLRLSSRLKEFIPVKVDGHESDIAEDKIASLIADFLAQLFIELKKPVIFFVDDAQWLTPLSVDILTKALVATRQAPVLWLMTARSEVSEFAFVEKRLNDAADDMFSRLDLGPLDFENSTKVVHRRLGLRQVPEFLNDQVHDLCAGVPYAIEQYVYSMIDSSVLTIEHGQWKINRERLSSLALPGDIKALLGKRLASLSPRAHELMKAGSIFGIQFEREIISEMLSWDDLALTPVLQEVQKAGLIEAKARQTIRFVHDKVLEKIREDLKVQDREALHTHAARSFERLRPEDAMSLAEHYMNGRFDQNMQRAFQVAVQAGVQTLLNNAGARAVDFFLFALKLAPQVGVAGEDLGKVEWRLAQALRRLGRYKESRDFGQLALNKITNKVLRAQIHTELAIGYMYGELNYPAAWVEITSGLNELAEPFPESFPKQLIQIFKYLARAAMARYLGYAGRLSETQKATIQSMVHLDRLGTFHTSGAYRSERVLLFSARLYFCAVLLGDTRDTALIYSSIQLIFGVMRKPEALERMYTRAQEVAGRFNDRFVSARIRQDHAMSYNFAGEPVKAQNLNEEIMEGWEKYILPDDYFRTGVDILVNLLSRGQTSQAIRYCEKTIQKAEELGMEPRKMIPYIVLAYVNQTLGRREEANEWRRKALELRDLSPNVLEQPPRGSVFYAAYLLFLLEKGVLEEEVDQLLVDYELLKVPPAKASVHQKLIFLAILRLRWHRLETDPSMQAEQELRVSLELLRKIGKSPQYLSHVRLVDAALARMSGQFELAEAALNEAEELSNKAEAPWALYENMLERAKLARQMNRPLEAKSRALLASEIASQQGWATREAHLVKEFNLAVKRNSAMTTYQSTQHISALASKRQTEALLRMSKVVAGVVDPGEQARRALDEMISLLGAERGFFFSLDDEGQPAVQIGRGANGEELTLLEGFSRTIVAKVHESREAIVVIGDEKGTYASIESVASKGLKSILVLPMFLKNDYIGIAYLDSHVARGLFSVEDLEICRSLGSYFAFAQEMARASQLEAQKAALKKDLELAAAVQNLFFPTENSFHHNRVSLSGIYKPSSICSGDWWWHALTPQGKILVFVLDVTGHGAPSAMVTGIIAALIRKALRENRGVKDLLYSTDDDVFAIIKKQLYATVSVLEIDSSTGSLEWWAGGSPPILIVSANGEMHVLSTNGSVLGMSSQGERFGNLKHKLKPGDRIYIFSDGLYELPLKPGIRYGMNQLVRTMVEAAKMPLDEAKQKVLDKVNSVIDTQEECDDMSLILVDFGKDEPAA